MPVKTKRKVVKKDAPLTPKYERLRLREWMLFWMLFAATLALVYAIFGDVDVRMLRPVGVKPDTTVVGVVTLPTYETPMPVQQPTSPAAPQIEDIPCTRNTNQNQAESHVTYVDPKTSVSMSIPYSFSWGIDECEIAPLVSSEEYSFIEFGPTSLSIRAASIEILPATTTASVLANVREKERLGKINGMDTVTAIRQRTVNGLTVISFSVDAAIGYTQGNWIAVGRNYVYEIKTTGWLTDAEAIKIIQSLRVTK